MLGGLIASTLVNAFKTQQTANEAKRKEAAKLTADEASDLGYPTAGLEAAATLRNVNDSADAGYVQDAIKTGKGITKGYAASPQAILPSAQTYVSHNAPAPQAATSAMSDVDSAFGGEPDMDEDDKKQAALDMHNMYMNS
jgi:hypothetical protein